MFTGAVGRLVVISSSDVYRVRDRLHGLDNTPADPLPLTEDAPLRSRLYPYRTTEDRPQYHYEKILVERAVLGNDSLPATVLRLPAVYGQGDFQHRTFKYLKRMDDQRPAILVNQDQLQWRWSRGYVENVAAAIALAATHPRAGGRIYKRSRRCAPASGSRTSPAPPTGTAKCSACPKEIYQRTSETTPWTGDTTGSSTPPEFAVSSGMWSLSL